jgi:hypothetical protein
MICVLYFVVGDVLRLFAHFELFAAGFGVQFKIYSTNLLRLLEFNSVFIKPVNANFFN